MTVSANDRLRTTINFVLPNGVQYQNVFTHTRTGIASISDATHIAVIKAWAEGMYGELSTLVEGTTVEQLSFVDKIGWSGTMWEVTEHIGTFTPTFTPTGTGDICPNQVSAFVTGKTSRPRSVGRKFLFPALEDNQDQGIITAGYVTQLVAWAADWINNIVLQANEYLVPGVLRTDFDVWLPFTVAVVTDLLGTQRRRRPGYGS